MDFFCSIFKGYEKIRQVLVRKDTEHEVRDFDAVIFRPLFYTADALQFQHVVTFEKGIVGTLPVGIALQASQFSSSCNHSGRSSFRMPRIISGRRNSSKICGRQKCNLRMSLISACWMAWMLGMPNFWAMIHSSAFVSS